MSASMINICWKHVTNTKDTEKLIGGKRRETVKENKTRRSGISKGNWIKKLRNYSPSEQQVASAPATTHTRAMKALDIPSRNESPNGVTSGSLQTPPQVLDLQTIVCEFEKGFLSPTKHEDVSNQKNFVKKLVAAFEVKYKSQNELQGSQETTPEGTPKRKSGISSPAKNNPGESQQSGKNIEITGNREEKSPEEARRSGISAHLKQFEKQDESPSRRPSRRKPAAYVSPYRIFFGEENFEDSSGVDEGETKSRNETPVTNTSSRSKPDDCKSHKRSGIFSSFGRRGSKDSLSESCASPTRSPRQNSKDSSSDCSSLSKFDREKSRRISSIPLSLNDTKTLEHVYLETSYDLVETISVGGHAIQKRTMIEDSEAVPRLDKTPKIVGAFLKKPIEVEETSIDWIPVTGKKLPRKRSLKKLLYSLTGNKLDRKSTLSSSENNLSEEPRELQDSGYDDKSCSSSSLTSLISVAEVLQQQENTYVEPERKPTLKTFGLRKLMGGGKASCDTDGAIRKSSKKRLLLTEVPREELKLDLGPCYPSPKIITMSLGRKSAPKKPPRDPAPVILKKLPKHPLCSKIPKHPFISTTKFDEPEESQEPHECRSNQEPSIIIKNDLYEVEFRASCDDICPSGSCRSLSPALSNYDVPRRFLSKSETSLIGCTTGLKTGENPIYDVPNPRPIERPRSSVFDEAQALKRSCVQHGSSIYAIPRDLKVRYATINPRMTYPKDDPISTRNGL
ncbi:uncharacterized protein LOC108625395 isoform X2 [Ceratina calcarata]|uniref:Uncharacterized protein LOC108625395 isoform X2 n=1 Tax=Ceratina calcarata TaxID=156304 RepID=A0AAJ7S1M1_9HYME|nr:uncharacterized protein LOC108625395 isoform X2 [Ceratina calcarata]